jgi:hypothetical protein
VKAFGVLTVPIGFAFINTGFNPAENMLEVTPVMVVELTTTKLVILNPTETFETDKRFVPVIVTAVPPATGPLVGLIDVNVGRSLYVNALVKVALPPLFVTTTFLAAPTVPEGVPAVIVVALTTTTLVQGLPPMVAVMEPAKLVPVMVTDCPPDVMPLVGLMAEIVGGSTEMPLLDPNPNRLLRRSIRCHSHVDGVR